MESLFSDTEPLVCVFVIDELSKPFQKTLMEGKCLMFAIAVENVADFGVLLFVPVCISSLYF